MQVAYLLIFVL